MATQVFEIKLPWHNYKWLDVTAPSKKFLEELAKEHNIHPRYIKDCLEPEHLPKIEKIGGMTMVVLRALDDELKDDATTVQDITRKIVIFYNEKIIITVHRKDQTYIKNIREQWSEYIKVENPKNHSSIGHPLHEQMILHDFLMGITESYGPILESGFDRLESLDDELLSPDHNHSSFDLKKGYFFKRRISLVKRMVRIQSELVDKITPTMEYALQIGFKHISGQLSKYYFYADDLLENVQSMVNLHVSMSSQKTNESSFRINEVTRLLTLFSVYFLPLNFIAGIYGMNFRFMPELEWGLGYPLALLVMLVTALCLHWWTKKKGWLK
jgi:magnesium transporter